jgi:hypothetical protein
MINIGLSLLIFTVGPEPTPPIPKTETENELNQHYPKSPSLKRF